MKTKAILFSIIFVTFIISTSAQEKKRKNISGNLSLTGTVQTGNSERILLINNVNFKVLSNTQKTSFESKSRYVYGTVGDFLKENDFRTSNYILLNANKKWNPVFGFYFEILRIKKMKSSVKPLAGVKYKLVDKEKIKISPSLLLGYSWQTYRGANFKDFDNGGYSEINGTNINFGVNATLNPIENKVVFNLFSIYQLGIEETENKRLWIDFNTLIPLYKGLSFRLSLNNYYENIILQGVKNNDLTISYGFGYKF